MIPLDLALCDLPAGQDQRLHSYSYFESRCPRWTLTKCAEGVTIGFQVAQDVPAELLLSHTSHHYFVRCVSIARGFSSPHCDGRSLYRISRVDCSDNRSMHRK
jgi:hypothetical protein